MGKRDIEKIFENAEAEVERNLEIARKCTTYAAVLYRKAKAEEAWGFIWMTIGGIDKEVDEEFKKEWERYNREFEKILATK